MPWAVTGRLAMWFILKSEVRLSLSPGIGLLEQRDPFLTALSAGDTVLLSLHLRRCLPTLHKQPYASIGLLKNPGMQLLKGAAEKPFL